MSGTANLFAHSDGGAVNLWGLVFVGVTMGAAALWLVSINRRLDAKEEEDTTMKPEGRSQVVTYLIGGVIVVALAGMMFAVYRAQSNLKNEQPQLVVSELCKASEQAKTDTVAALGTFNGKPHDALHTLISNLDAKDAAASGRLSRAKSQAEEGLIAKSPDAPEFVKTLADQTAKGYRIVDPSITLTACA